nr:hypothetical protein [candidate division Zixibacteria bacterium]
MNRLKIRWIIFAGLALVIIISYIIRIDLDTKPSPLVQKSYDYIESLPESTVVMFCFDHEASSLPEIKPIALAMLRHAIRKNLKIIGLSTFAEGTAIGYMLMTKTAQEYGREYGRDYVFLGFRPQHISVFLAMGESISHAFPLDYLGNRVDTIPMMRAVDNYDDIDMVISIADGDRTTQWVEYAGARYHQKIMGGITSAMITSYDPYLASGQLYSVVGGLVGAAEYEILLGTRAAGNRGILAQTSAHIYVIAMIIIGNIVYFRMRKGRG